MITVVDDQTTIPVNERIAQYGDGCFTTMAVSNGKVELFEDHINRLQKACNVLFIDFTDWNNLIGVVQKNAKSHDACVIKIQISRGVGGRGYGTRLVSSANCYVSQSNIPDIYTHQQSKGITVGVSTVALSNQPVLAGIKHANRLEQVLAKIELESSDYDDVIVCDVEGNIIEATAANIFLYKNDTWYTPALDNCGVEGVMRNFLVSIMSKNHLKVEEKPIPLVELKQYERAFICNSLMKIIPVNSIEIRKGVFHDFEPNRDFIEWFKTIQQEVSLDA